MNNILDKIDDQYDVVVIGGGIVGAGIIRDLALNNVKALLIEKKDFASQTSSKSSKMLHGGIRYLENMDFELVYEALHEKNLWLRLTPHLCYESAFYMPIFKDSIRPKWMLKIGLLLYDLLAMFKQSSHQMLSKKEVLKRVKNIKKASVLGAGLYHDAVVDDARLAIECIVDAKSTGNIDAINHCEAMTYLFKKDLIEIDILDHITKQNKKVFAKDIIFATGPFTDDILNNIPEINWKNRLLPSRGSHLWLKPNVIQTDNPLVLTPKDGRVIFVIPQKDRCLVGTTEAEHDGDKFDIEASHEEIKYLKKNICEYFDIDSISDDDIISSFSGIRPLVKDHSGSRGKTARNHMIFQPRKNVHVIIGGKYTTFRVMAQEIVKQVCQRQGKEYNSLFSNGQFKHEPYYFPFDKEKNNENSYDKIRELEFVRTEKDFQRRIS